MIIQTVQVTHSEELLLLTPDFVSILKRHTARLQYLAHLVSESLISIAEQMKCKWDGAPPVLKIQLDVFEA